MDASTRFFLSLSAVAACVKLLLIPAYKSTDFEVHRNWLAITHSLPMSRWYVDETSQWTLDYPPLFAWMEKLLSYAAKWFDAEMLVVDNINYSSKMTIIFQRLSVIVTDTVLTYAVYCWMRHCSTSNHHSEDKLKGNCAHPQLIVTLLSLGNVGLLLVDSIHFQYNGFLFGVFLLSILRVVQRRYLESALWFATLLNLKHIYLYVAPAYGVYLLRVYCFSNTRHLQISSFHLSHFLQLAFIVASIFALSFGPFMCAGQTMQVIARLFPFKRGLCHAYWAPNFWALYNTADKAAGVIARRLGLTTAQHLASMTGGLVQEFEHEVFPSVKPVYTLVLTAVSILPALFCTWMRPHSTKSFVRCVVLCAFGAFMFGWHVHEKAILLVLIPLACLAATNQRDAEVFALLSVVGYYSLLPLIFTPAESVIKYCLLAMHAVYTFHALGTLFVDKQNLKIFRLPLLCIPETVYVCGLLFVELYCQMLHELLGLSEKLPFLPLMLTSVYAAIGVMYVWVKSYYCLITNK